jgi:hypothetical protein
LVFYKFNDEEEKYKKNEEMKSDLEIIGMLSNKMEREGFWVTPSQMNSENCLEGMILDEINDNNIILL